jgi:hypothetical protein
MTEPTTTPTPAAKAVGGLTVLKNLLAEIATLQRPVTASAVAVFILALIPGVGLTVTEATAIVAGVGALDAALTQVAK